VGWLFRSKSTPIWGLLFSATCLSWVLRSCNVFRTGLSWELTGLAVMLIAMVKIRFILNHFMELQRAPWIWRAVFETWIATVGIALVTVYVMR
jgi:heme/copper-type cytochrome/quinol oxidase subunit 4